MPTVMTNNFDSTTLIKAFVLLFAIVDAFGTVPVFVAMTAADEPSHRRRTARRACVVAFFVLSGFGLFGHWILAYFDVGIPSFKVAGGLALAVTSLPMFMGRRAGARIRADEEAEAVDKDDISIVPLAFPLLSGPGAITTMMVLAQQFAAPLPRIYLIAITGLVILISYLILASASRLTRLLGAIGLNVLTRILGLIILVLAVQFIMEGAKTFFLNQ